MDDESNSCWSCHHLILDLSKGYVCRKTGKVIATRENRHAVNKAADCKNWNR